MAQVKQSVVINRSIEDVFQYIADFENYPKWQHSILDCKKESEGAIGVGTIYKTMMVYMGKDYKAPLEITEHETNRMITFFVSQFGFFKWFRGRFIFEEVNSSTRVSIVAEADVERPYKPMLLIMPFYGKRLWKKHFTELKRILETDA